MSTLKYVYIEMFLSILDIPVLICWSLMYLSIYLAMYLFIYILFPCGVFTCVSLTSHGEVIILGAFLA